MKFLNIDLEITSRQRPKTLLGDFAGRVLILHDGKVPKGYFTAVELSSSPKTEALALAGFLELLKGLSEKGKEELASARKKCLNFGYSKAQGKHFEHSFPPAILSAISNLGCELAFTIYDEQTEAEPTRPANVASRRG
jgi:hypothetical protein